MGLQLFKCSGCGAYYNKNDYKTDSIVCSKCGKEIGTELYLDLKNEKEEIEKFLTSSEYERVSGTLTEGEFGKMMPVYIMLIVCVPTILTVWYKLAHDQGLPWWLILLIGLCIYLPFSLKKDNDQAKKFKNFIKSHNYSLEQMSRSIDQFDPESVVFKGYKWLETYVKSRNEIKDKYKAEGQGVIADDNVSSGSQEEHDIYLSIPNICPSCDAPYKASQHKDKLVKCDKCGYEIKNIQAENNSELNDLVNRFIQSIRSNKNQKYMMKVGFVLTIGSMLLLYYAYSQNGYQIEKVLYSWWLLLVLFMGTGISTVIAQIITELRISKLAKNKHFTLLDLDVLMRMLHSNDHIENETMDDYYAFKIKLNEYYTKMN
ncbi:MAG: hypothetical protein JEZ14_01900 [Marinilabiliaceae bacterium]|nr:hypothetical protein [Marinilabiliaceae bacterium]